jgi:bacillithiol biosynthesis deacetylase BshB1
MNYDAIFFGAHPDDVEIGYAGTIASLTAQNKKVAIVDVTSAELSTRGDIITRKQEALNAAKILGVQERVILDIPDGNIQVNKENTIKVIEIIRKYKPKLIFAPYFNDRHPDHINISRLIKEAYFYSGLQKISTMVDGKKQDFYRPRNLFYYMTYFIFEPSFVIDISDFMETKIQALKAYKSQFYNPDSDEPLTLIAKADFFDYIKSRNQIYGFRIGKSFAEPYFYEDYLMYDFNILFNNS